MTPYQTHREELRVALQQSFLDALLKMGDDANGLGFFAGNSPFPAIDDDDEE